MKYRKLGRTEISVSSICLGCMGLVGVNQDEADSVAAIHTALDAGINFFDTARAYQNGRNEELLGDVLASKRHKVVIATKLNFLRPGQITSQCEESLKRLKTDYIDLYQTHWPVPGADLGQAMSELEKLKADGKIRSIGVSNFGLSYIKRILATGVRVESNQLPYNLLWRPIEHEILPKCLENDISIMCYSALNMGLLTGKYKSANEVPQSITPQRMFSSKRPGSQHSEPGCEDELFTALDRIRAISNSVGEPMNVVCLAWLLAQKGITSVIAGARFPRQIEQNVRAAGLQLRKDVIDELTKTSEDIKVYAGTNADQWESVSRMDIG